MRGDDQWGIRIAHCDRAEPHKWHGWVGGNEDLRCPGVAAVPVVVADVVVLDAEQGLAAADSPQETDQA